jgi:predicted GNAT family acetyltransferase
VEHSSSKADQELDETLEETFPASDAPANTTETGIRTGASLLPRVEISDNTVLNRFEVAVNGQIAFLAYERTRDTLTLIHTEVPEPLRGRHFGAALVTAALEAGRSAGLRIVTICPFAREYLRNHPPSS